MAKNWKSYFNVSARSTDWVFGNLGYVLFLGFLAILYIANAHFAEKKVREIQLAQKRIRELRWEYMSIKSELMRRSTQTEIGEAVEANGLRADGAGLKVIEVKP